MLGPPASFLWLEQLPPADPVSFLDLPLPEQARFPNWGLLALFQLAVPRQNCQQLKLPSLERHWCHHPQ